MNTLNKIKNYLMLAMVATSLIFTGCKKDDVDPDHEHEGEIITDVKLVFTNTSDASDVVEARAQDPDGEGVQELAILDEISLDTSKTYTLTFEIMNNLETPGEDIGAEIAEEDDEHQVFFSFTDNAFSNPTGDGNIDNASDAINYNDVDGNNNPLGLSTTWSTGASAVSAGTFTVRLQHQPDVKTATSGANDGDTDFELQFVMNIQ
tara:strand:- start:911 stop:1528 length:618 start_codon:yes stop_codon:yes gene_type:complete